MIVGPLLVDVVDVAVVVVRDPVLVPEPVPVPVPDVVSEVDVCATTYLEAPIVKMA